MFVWTSIISDAVSRMMVGNSGRFKKGVEKDTRVNVDVVPISDVIGALWTINGEENDVKMALEIFHAIYSNTVLKTGKSQQKFLTPPPTSTNVERLFSTASLILEDRPRLLPSWN